MCTEKRPVDSERIQRSMRQETLGSVWEEIMAAWCSNAGEINQHNQQQQEWSEENDEAGLVTLNKPSQLIRIIWWGVWLGASAWTNAKRFQISILLHSFTRLPGINQKGCILDYWKETNIVLAEILILFICPWAKMHFFFSKLLNCFPFQ